MPKYFIFKNLSTSWQQLLVWPKTQRFCSWWSCLCAEADLKSCAVPLDQSLAQVSNSSTKWTSGSGQSWHWDIALGRRCRDSIILGGILIHDKDKQKEQTPAEAIRQVATANSSPDDHSTRKLPPNCPIFSRSSVPASLTTCKCHLLLKPHLHHQTGKKTVKGSHFFTYGWHRVLI